MDTDVLVVGAGPTGLMLANQLVRRGVRTLIIDRHTGPSIESRALGVQARTLEIYSHLGIVGRALELGKRGTGGNIWANGKRRARVGLSDAGQKVTPYPFLLILGQDDNERILGDHLRALGSSVQWNTELISLAQQADCVTAVLRLPDGSHRNVLAPWVAGCDGARSLVRESSGITFAGAAYEHVFFVADTEMTGSMVPDELNVYLFHNGFHLLFPMRGKDHWRIAGILPPALRDKPDLKFDAVIPFAAYRSGRRIVDSVLQLVLHLPHPSPKGSALSRPPLLPPRRRGTHPQPGRRAGHEHRFAGRLQPRVEAGSGRQGPGRTGAARFL